MLDEPPYRLSVDSGKFAIIDWQGQTLISCRDEQSAQHYLELLTRAFRQGYRHGFRAARIK